MSTETGTSGLGVQELLDSSLHFGHQTKRWNPKMKRYIFGARNGIYIIDLLKSLEKLKEAQSFLYEISLRGRKVLFVGTKKQAQEPMKQMAERLGQPYVTNRWLGGMLTNARTVRKSVQRMRELQKMGEDGTFDSMNKKEVARLRRELNKIEHNLSGVADMEQLPGAIFITDINRESLAVKEAGLLHIPIVALVDTNCDPDPIDYVIPGNDDAMRAIQLVVEALGHSIKEGSESYEKVAAEEARIRAEKEAEEQAKRKAAEEERKRRDEEKKKARKAAIAKAKAKKKEEEVSKPAASEKAAAEAAAPKAETKEAPVEEKAAAPETKEAPVPEEKAAPAEEKAASVEEKDAPVEVKAEKVEEEIPSEEEKKSE